MFEGYKRYRDLKKNTKLNTDEKFKVDQDGRGVIEIGAENYEDIFSYYSLNGSNVLDGEFVNFLETKADAIPLKYDLSLHFHVKKPDEIKEREIKYVLKESYEREIHSINRQLHNKTLFTLYMLLMGSLCFAIFVILTIFQAYFVFTAIAEIASWVFLWETVNNFFMQRRQLKALRMKKYRIMKSTVVMQNFKLKSFEKNVTKKAPATKKHKTSQKNSTQSWVFLLLTLFFYIVVNAKYTLVSPLVLKLVTSQFNAWFCSLLEAVTSCFKIILYSLSICKM